ncbi:MAG: tetratricopeptide repeat protein [Acidobacteriota bacterium]|nr:tetratricopeptide repeat protein [Acidobacteriota bacterium]
MAKKKRPMNRRAFKAQPAQMLFGLEKAAALMRGNRWLEARELLEQLDQRYPDRLEVLTDLTNVNLELNDMAGHLWACERVAKLMPGDPDLLVTLAGSYLMNFYPARALLTFRRYLNLWPDHERAAEVREQIVDLSAKLDELLSDLGESGEEGLEIAALHEEARLLLEHGKYRQGQKVAEKLLEKRPDFIPALNNLSQMLHVEGDADEAIAIAERVLELDPENFHALANLARFLYLQGYADQAAERAVRLTAVTSDAEESWIKKMEALSFLGDDQGVLEVFRASQQSGTDDVPILYHWAAVAALRQGREDEARRQWRKALELEPGFDLAQENLDDLRRAVGARHAPWPFAFSNWVTRSVIEELYRLVEPAARRHDEKAMQRGAQRFLEKRPEIVRLTPALFDRGDAAGREFAMRTAMMTESPEMLEALRDFALSQRGPDEMRIEAANVAASAGLMPTGPTQLWIKGEWQELLLLGFEIHTDTVNPLKPKATRLVSEALEALNERQAEEGERLLKQALKIEPDSPAILNNLAMAYELQGRKDEALALEQAIHERFPDYLFARVGLARKCIADGQLDEAAALLEPLLQRRRIHAAEFVVLCNAQIELFVAQKNTEAARSWLEMWAGIDPDHPGVAQWRARLGRNMKEKLSGLSSLLTGGRA